MRRTKEDAELTRQSLLKAATKVFSQHGYAATRLEDIAEAANVTRGAVYHHFEGKAELFAEIIDEASQISNRAVQRAIQEGGMFLEIIKRILMYSTQLLLEDTQYRAATALLLFNSWDSAELASMRTRHLEGYRAMMEQIVGYFREAVAQGDIRTDLDPEVVAQGFMAYQNGLALLWLVSPDLIDVEKHSQGLADVFMQGIAPR
ncbi:MAG: TetR family transcriptional regulator [Anaerolineaceae bacterium]|nr:TetR family transcriptional regulator [Anaerolineaceae bacterium]